MQRLTKYRVTSLCPRLALVILGATLGLGGVAQAAPPWAKLIPLKRVEADAEKSYELTETNGPWLVMCTSFVGPNAELQAHDLVLELRRSQKLEAFVYRQHFDFTKPEPGLGVNRYGAPKMMKNKNGQKFDEIAVMVGNFSSVDQPEVERVLKQIKFARLNTLDPSKNNESNQRIIRMYQSLVPGQTGNTKGPLGSAFVTRNPLLPDDYFAPKGLEPFVVELNRDLPHSLLTNPAKFTVKVASFKGVDTFKPDEYLEKTNSNRGKMSKIDEAALKASKLTKALREQGVEAYEWHDRTESIVTIGSFDSVGEPRPDGKLEINPAVHRLMQAYGPVKEAVPGQNHSVLKPRVLEGVAFDTQPLPVQVPKQSIANAYARRAD